MATRNSTAAPRGNRTARSTSQNAPHSPAPQRKPDTAQPLLVSVARFLDQRWIENAAGIAQELADERERHFALVESIRVLLTPPPNGDSPHPIALLLSELLSNLLCDTDRADNLAKSLALGALSRHA